MGVLDTCKTEEDPFKNEGARVVIIRYSIVCLCRFYDAQWQFNQQSKVDSTSGLNSSKFLWLPLLPERMKKIQSKVRTLEWSQQYPSVFKMLKGS